MSLVYLVGVDCSDCGGRALDYAAERANATAGKLLVAHVIEWSPFQFSTAQENEERSKRRREELERASTEVVGPIIESLKARGIDAEGIVRHGHAAETLHDLADERGATNIIIGRKGGSKLKSKLFGSVASTLVQIADCPVTVVP